MRMRDILGASVERLGEAVDTGGNWKTFDALGPDEVVVLYHATHLDAARAILSGGFQAPGKVWRDSGDGYCYVGTSPASLSVYAVHAAQGKSPPCILKLQARKGDIEPDNGSDWRSHLRKNPRNKRDVIDRFGKAALTNPSATATLAEISQARVPARKIAPIAILDLDGRPYQGA